MSTIRNLLSLLLISGTISASEESRAQYFDLIKRYPNLVQPQGSAAKGEIEIILDDAKMAAIEQETGRIVGVVHQDNYWIWINDACLFPSGKEGVYGRVLWRQPLGAVAGGAVVMAIKDNKVMLNCNFRHATRSWEIELPRGTLNLGETAEEGARREVTEETGLVVSELYKLGEMCPDTGFTNTVCPIFMARVVEKQVAQPEDSEAIAEILTLSIAEIKEAYVKGYLLRTIHDKEVKVHVRDPFLAYAILLYEAGRQ